MGSRSGKITERQLRMLELRSQGATLKEVGDAFGVTPEGVRINVNMAIHYISQRGLQQVLPEGITTQYSHTELLHVPPKDKSRCFFHVTPMENVQNIMEHGLVPKIGERSGAQGEETPAIYLFPTMDDMDNALSNWLGEWFEDAYGPDVEFAIVKAFLPPDIYVHYDLSAAYECYVTEPIPSRHLFFFTESGEPLRKSLDRVISDTSRRVSVADLSSASLWTARSPVPASVPAASRNPSPAGKPSAETELMI